MLQNKISIFEHHLYNYASYKMPKSISQSLLFQDTICIRFDYVAPTWSRLYAIAHVFILYK